MSTPNINSILKSNPRRCAGGAPMGSPDRFAGELSPMYLQKVSMVDGDYAADGTYWGGGSSLGDIWCAFDRYLSNCIYVRATSRAKALQAVLLDYPNALFIRH